MIFRVVSVSHSDEAVGAVGGELLAVREEETKMPAEGVSTLGVTSRKNVQITPLPFPQFGKRVQLFLRREDNNACGGVSTFSPRDKRSILGKSAD